MTHSPEHTGVLPSATDQQQSMIQDIPIVTEITATDLPWLDTGAGILGTGGGGDPRLGRLRLQSIFANEEYPDSVQLISPTDLPPDAVVTSVGGMGAPTISREKFPKGDEDLNSLRALERAADVEVDAIIPGEIGGANSMAPLCVAAMAGLPVIDGDGMGRAFPELQMDTFFIYDQAANYAALTDERGNQVTYTDVHSPAQLEALARSITIDMGGRAGYAFPVMDGGFVSKYCVSETVSLARELGRCIHRAREESTAPVRAARDLLGAKSLFTGKIVDVFRRNRDGFAKGEIELAALSGTESLFIEFQNEFLIARTESGEVRLTVPDLICIVDKDTGEPITTGSLRYGQRVTILGVPAPELLTSEPALNVIGPRAFGYDTEYVPVSGADE